MRIRPLARTVAWGVAVIVLVANAAACGPPPASVAVPTASAVPGPTIDLRGLHAYPSIEARIPKHVGDVDVDTVSLDLATAGEDAEPLPFADALAKLGRAASDVHVAVGGPTADGRDLVIAVVQVSGVASDAALKLFTDDTAGTIGTADIGGRSVVSIDGEEGAAYAFVVGDAVVLVSGEANLVDEAVRAIR